MKYPTMRFVFDRKKVATKTHKGLVQIEVLSEGKRKWIGTGVKVYSDQWNDRKKIINSVEMIQLNQCLDEQLRIIQNWINELISKKEVFDFDKLDRFLRYTNKSESFVDWKIQCKLPPKTKRFCPLKTFNNAPLKSLDR